MAELYRFAAFISYSSKNADFARRLHKALERYRIPKSLGAFDVLGEGGAANRIYPVFRDREELSAGDLGERIEAALRASSALIVVCTPESAASPWVQKEIEYFSALGRRGRIFAIIPDEAASLATSSDPRLCFPPALRLGGEPLAADARKGRDGFHGALLKLVAGLVDINAGALEDRDRKSGQWRALQLAAAAVAGLAAMGMASAAIVSNQLQERVNTLAELARRASDDGRYETALRYALAGLVGHDWPFVQVDFSAAEAELRRARVEGPLVATFFNTTGAHFGAEGSRLLLETFIPGNDDLGARTALLVDAFSGRQIAVLPGRPESWPMSAFSPSGDLFVTTSADDGVVRIWNAADASAVATLAHEGRVGETEFSHDSTRLVTVASDGVRIWDARRGVELVSMSLPRIDNEREHYGGAIRLSFSADDTHVIATIAIAQLAYETRIWEAATGRLILRTGGIHNDTSADGELVAIEDSDASGARSTNILEIRTGRLAATIPGSCPVISPNNQLAYTRTDNGGRLWRLSDATESTALGAACYSAPLFSRDGALLIGREGIWDTESGRQVAELQGDFAISADRTRVLSMGQARLRLLDARSGIAIATRDDLPNVEYAEFSPSGRLLATVFTDTSIAIWDAGAGELSRWIRGHRANGYVEFNEPENRLVTSLQSTRLWDLTSQAVALRGHEDHIQSVAFSADGGRLVSASADGAVRIWNTATGRETAAIRSGEGSITAASLSADGAQIVVASENGALGLWDAARARRLMRIRTDQAGGFRSVSFSPDGATIVAASANIQVPVVRIFDVASGQELGSVPGCAAAHSPDGSLLAVSCWGRPLTLVNAHTGRVLAQMTGRARESLHDLSPTRIEFSRDGRRLMVVEGDTSVRIWDWASRRETAVMEGHEGVIWNAAFNPAGDRVATASVDRTAKIWDVATGRELVTLRGHSEEVTDIQWDPSGRFVLTASSDGTTRIWESVSGHQVDVLTRNEGGFPRATWRPDGSYAAATDGNSIFLWRMNSALYLERVQLMENVCERLLPGEEASLDDAELSQAPVLRASLDADVCRPAGMWRRLSLLR
jgi:WD40 repeat protein